MTRSALLRAFIVLVSMLALGATPVRADLALSVLPARYELEATPGESKTIPLMVRNESSNTLHVVTSLTDFAIDPNGKYAFLATGKTRYSAGTFSTVNPREFDIQAGTSVEVRFTVSPPRGATGEYRSLVFFATRPPRKPGALAIAEKVASRMYVIMRDTAKVGGDVTRVVARELAPGRAYDVMFKNAGNMHAYLNGYVEVNSGTTLVERITLPSDTVVERNGSRVLTATGKSLPPGSYSATAVLDFGGDARVGGRTTFVVR